MSITVNFKEYPAPPVDYKEIRRYFNSPNASTDIDEIIRECIDRSVGKLTYKVCYAQIPISVSNNCVDVGFMCINSNSLTRYFCGCDSAVLFAATIGIEIDRLISRYSRLSPVRSLCLQAIGTERIEALCDTFCDDIKEKYEQLGYRPLPRYSPGYGDLSLDCQRDIITVFDCYRKIGLTLTDGLHMIPSKSVTAFVGLKKGT